MIKKTIKVIQAYKASNPDKVAQYEELVYDISAIAGIIGGAVVLKVLLNQRHMKQELKTISKNLDHIYWNL